MRSDATQRGFSLPELILLLVVMAVGLVGILTVTHNAVRDSAEPMQRKQAMAIAESLMEEILSQPFTAGPGGGTRNQFDDVLDYNNYKGNASQKIEDINGVAIADLTNYSLLVTVAATAVGGVPSGNAFQVTIAVTAPNPNASYALTGFKIRY